MEKVYQRIFEYSPDALLVVDQAGCIALANTQAETLFGHDRRELIGQPVEILMPARFAAHHHGHRSRFMVESNSRQMGLANNLFAQRKDGSELPVDIMLSPMIVEGHHCTLCVVRDITERKAAEDKLRQQTTELQKLHIDLKEIACRDSLTGLLNRRAFHEHAEQMLKTARRRGENVSLLMIDLDHFKQVNDRFGHAEGDKVLIMAADTLRATARENDLLSRHGGEEFVIAILGANEPESLLAAERLRVAVAAIKNKSINITASIGVTTTTMRQTYKRKASEILAELLDQADRALYTAKHNGRNQVCHFNRLTQADFQADEIIA